MPLELHSKRKSLAVSGEMNIYTAREGCDLLLPKLRAAASPSLDLAQVTEFDSSGLQVLLMANREAVAAGKTLKITAASGPVHDALMLTQCEELLSRLGGAA
jgi:anti-sigma B factor antagonist